MDINISIDVPAEQLVDILRQREINSKPEKIEYWIDPEIYSYSLWNKRLQIKMPLVYCVNEKNFRCAPGFCIYIGWDKKIDKITIGKTQKTKDLNSFAKLLTSDDQLLRSLIGKILRGDLPPEIIDFDPTKYFSTLQEIDSVIDSLYSELVYTRQNNHISLAPKNRPGILLRTDFSIRTRTKDQILRILDDSNKLLEGLEKASGDLFNDSSHLLNINPLYNNDTTGYTLWVTRNYKKEQPQFVFATPTVVGYNWESALLKIKGSLITLQKAYDLIKQIKPKQIGEYFYFDIDASSSDILIPKSYRIYNLLKASKPNIFNLSKKEGVDEFRKFLKNIK